jgi:hypothetical protein
MGLHFQNQAYYEQYGNDQVYSGILTPRLSRSLPLPPVCGYVARPDAAVLSLGNHSAWWITKNNSDIKCVAIRNGECIVGFKKNAAQGILLTTEVRDGNGESAISIKNNRFQIDPNKVKRVLVPDGAMGSSLSVYDLLDRRILQVDFRNPLNMYMTGTFGEAHQYPFIIGDAGFSLGGLNKAAFCPGDNTVAMFVFR